MSTAVDAEAIHVFNNGINSRWLIGTHGGQIRRPCAAILQQAEYRLEVDERRVPGQPDGIIVARSK